MTESDEGDFSPGRAFLVPLIQSLITGAWLGFVAAMVAITAGIPNPWPTGGLVAALSGAIAWLAALRRWAAWAYWQAPDDSDDPQGVTVIHTEATQGGDVMRYADLPASLGQLQALSQGLTSGLSFAEGNWTGAGRPFSRSQFQALRAELIGRGFLAYRNPTAPDRGVVLTNPGRAMVRYFTTAASPALSQQAPDRAS